MKDIYPCGRFSDCEAYKIGNIFESISARGNDIIREIKSRRKEKLAKKCIE